MALPDHLSDKCDISCFKILDHASTYSQLKIKESFHIEQLTDLNSTNKLSTLVCRCISLYCCLLFPLFLFLVYHFIGYFK